MKLYLRLCFLLAGFVYGQTARAQITITSVTPITRCAGSDIIVSYSNTYPGQAALSLYLYSANSTDSVNIAQLSSSTGSGTLYPSLPISLATKSYTVGIKLIFPQATYQSPRSTEFMISAIPSSPIASSAVSYCQNDTSSPLSATASSGGTLTWYMSSTGGPSFTVAPTPPTNTAGSIGYWVSQTVDGCESPRINVWVTIKPLPPPPTVAASVIVYCEGATAIPLSATPNTGGTLQWYTNPVGSAGATSITPTTKVAGVFNYYVSQIVDGCESPRTSIAVYTMPLPSAPSITTSPVYCQNAPSTPLSARAGVGGTLNWYTTPTGGTRYGILVPPTNTPGTFTYYASQTTNGLCEGPRASISVTINPNPIVSINPGSATLTTAQPSLTLTAIASVSNLLWSTSETSASVLANVAGVYSVTATSNEGCTATATSIISQSEVYTIKAGSWDDITTWSINQLPTSVDVVRLRHPVSLPAGYQAQVSQIRYDEGGVLQMGSDSYVKLRQ